MPVAGRACATACRRNRSAGSAATPAGVGIEVGNECSPFGAVAAPPGDLQLQPLNTDQRNAAGRQNRPRQYHLITDCP